MTKEPRRAILVVYSRFETRDGRNLAAGEIFDAFVRRGYWLAPRLPAEAENGMRVVFYESSAGFTGVGRLERVEASRGTDWTLPDPTSVSLFPKKLTLCDVVVFAEPVPAKPLLDLLAFITQKEHWGQAFRYSPRLIPDSDVANILRAAPPSSEATTTHDS